MHRGSYFDERFDKKRTLCLSQRLLCSLQLIFSNFYFNFFYVLFSNQYQTLFKNTAFLLSIFKRTEVIHLLVMSKLLPSTTSKYISWLNLEHSYWRHHLLLCTLAIIAANIFNIIYTPLNFYRRCRRSDDNFHEYKSWMW